MMMLMLLWHTDSSINHNHNHNHSRQSSFNQSIARSSSNNKQPRTTSSGSMIESMPTKRQRETQREQECINERETHLDLESIEQSLASWRRALVFG